MTLLVTGGAGFIGSAVVRRALAEGRRVVNLDKLTYAANLENLASAAHHPGYAFVQADICDGEAVRQVFERYRPEAVMHLAAESHVDRSIDGPLVFVRTNVEGTAVMLEAARRHWSALEPGPREAFRFMHISTDEVFGSLETEGRFDEQTPYAPRSPYSASKAGSDMLVRAWAETFGLPCLISNCSNNYGPFQFPEKLLPTVVLNALDGRPIPVYGRGENVRDWLHVDDHAEALLSILDRGRPGETYCIGGDGEVSNLELVHRICAALDALRPEAAPHAELIRFVTDRPGHDFRYAIDHGKLTGELGWRPRTPLDQGLADTVRWYLENRSWWAGIRARGFSGGRLGLAPGARA